MNMNLYNKVCSSSIRRNSIHRFTLEIQTRSLLRSKCYSATQRYSCYKIDDNEKRSFPVTKSSQCKIAPENLPLCRYFSSSKGENDPIITVTQTSNNESSSSSTTTSNDEATTSSEESHQSEGENQQNQPQKLKKSSQQIAEEELYNLMSESRQHYQHANYTEALTTANEFLSQATALFGPSHPAVASAHNNVGLMNKMIGDYTTSRESYHTALNIYQKIVGEDHENYAATLHNLGVLDKTQAMLDEELKQIEKMTFVDRSVEYFEMALKIRQNELGMEHVHTVSSRSNLGNAIAAQVIMSETMRQNQARKKMENEKDAKVSGSDETYTGTSSDVSKFTIQKWEMAEKNLREALRIAIDNPRGEIIDIKSSTTKSASNQSTSRSNIPKAKRGTARQRKMAKKNMEQSTNEEHELKIEDKSQGTNVQASSALASSSSSSFGLGDTSIRTVSSAHAAQNLAVFLKTRGDLISSSNQLKNKANENSNNDESKSSTTALISSLDSGDMYAEAKNLYIGALRVRTLLKGETHPDTVASKFSLAELIDILGDEEGANKLRQELLDVYEVEERVR